MVVWSSSIYRSLTQTNPIGYALKPGPLSLKNALQIRKMSSHGPRLMNIQPSRFQWKKFKDLFHFYVLLGVIPLSALVFFVNVFIGPATLTSIPEGYVPQHWEYHKHPISRFMARYIYASPQQDYEKQLHSIFTEHETMQLRFLEQKVKESIRDRRDYQAYYYRPVSAKHLRISKEAAEHLSSIN